MFPPEPVDQPVARDGLVRVEEKHREQRALLWPAERQLTAVAPRLDATEKPELHRDQLSTVAGRLRGSCDVPSARS